MILAIGEVGRITNELRENTTHSELINAHYVFADSDPGYGPFKFTNTKIGSTILLDPDNKKGFDGIFKDIECLFIVASSSGICSSKLSLVAAESAKLAGVEHIFVTGMLPFYFEGYKRITCAIQNIRNLKSKSGINVVAINLPGYYERCSDLDIERAYELIDIDIAKKLEQIFDSLKSGFFVWYDYSLNGCCNDLESLTEKYLYDVLSVLTKNGENWLVTSDEDDLSDSVKVAIEKLSLCIDKLEKVFIYITCNLKNLTFRKLSTSLEILQQKLNSNPFIKYKIENSSLKDSFEVKILASYDYSA